MNEKKDSRPSSLSSTYQGYLDTLAKSRIVPSRLLSGITTLPGMESAGLFRVEAKRYGADRLERVLAIGRPTA